jgi:recombination protein RecA
MSFNKVKALINKKYGDGTMVIASEVLPSGRVTSGSLALDVILGGGWPTNKWHEIVGEASNGKTALALKTIAANQKLNPNFTTVWVAAEQWVPEYAEMCGVDLARVHVLNTNVMEIALNAVLDIVETKEVDCVVIDSLPALVPSAEDEKEMEEFTVGRAAMLMAKFFRKMEKAGSRSLINPERPFIGLIINQYRLKIGVSQYADPRTTPGGEAKNYFFFTRVEVKRDEWIEVGTGKSKARIGQTIKFSTKKNKTAPPSQSAFVDFYFAEGGAVSKGEYDFAKEIVALGYLYKVIARAGAYYRYAGRQWLGADALLASLREEIDLKESLEREVLEVVKTHGTVGADPTEEPDEE